MPLSKQPTLLFLLWIFVAVQSKTTDLKRSHSRTRFSRASHHNATIFGKDDLPNLDSESLKHHGNKTTHHFQKICQPRATEELYGILRNEGASIGSYAEIVPQLFPNLLEEWPAIDKNMTEGELIRAERKIEKLLKKEIKRQLKKDRKSKKKNKRVSSYSLPGDVTHRLPNHKGSTIIDYCVKRGTETADGHRHLCTACTATTRLTKDFFPRYINEVICSTDENERGCLLGNGDCVQGEVIQTVLKRTGECSPKMEHNRLVFVETWEPFELSVRSYCQCQVKAQSIVGEHFML